MFLCKRSGAGLGGGSLFTQTYSGTGGLESKTQRRVGTARLEGMRASHGLGGEETSWGRRCQEADF